MKNASWHHQVIAVTGSSGSGKTTLCKELESLGAFTLNADDLAREAAVIAAVELRRTFGDSVFNPDNTLNRKLLREIVFGNPEQLKILEGILHPIVAGLAESRFKAALQNGQTLLIYDVPLLFESGLTSFKKTILVTAPRATLEQRLQDRDDLTMSAIQQRLAAQLPQEEKAQRADLIIENSGTLEELKLKARNLLKTL